MMCKKIKTKAIFAVVLIAFLALMSIHTSAASGSFSASASKTTLNVGETATIAVTVSGCEGQFTFSSSNANVASIDASSKWIGGESGGTFTLTVSAKSAGTANITITAANVSDTSFEEVSGSKTVTITVNAQAQQDQSKSNASLKSITVGSQVLNNPRTDETVKVDANVNSITVSAVAADSNAKVTGTGSKELKTGTNNVYITVTNPDGAKKEYVVRIRKLADTSNTTPNVQEENKPQAQQIDEPSEPIENPEEALQLKYLMVQDVELLPEFTPEVFNYRAEVTNLEKLDIVAAAKDETPDGNTVPVKPANDETAIVQITGNEDFKEGKNEVIIKVSKEGKDTVEYKIEVTKKTAELLIGQEETDGTGGAGTVTNGEKIKKIAIGFTAGIAIISLVLVIWKIKDGSNMASRARRAADRRHSFDDFD